MTSTCKSVHAAPPMHNISAVYHGTYIVSELMLTIAEAIARCESRRMYTKMYMFHSHRGHQWSAKSCEMARDCARLREIARCVVAVGASWGAANLRRSPPISADLRRSRAISRTGLKPNHASAHAFGDISATSRRYLGRTGFNPNHASAHAFGEFIGSGG